MPTATSPPVSSGAQRERPTGERSVRQIIAAGRSAPPPAQGTWLLAGLSGVLMWAAFTPLDWAPLAWLAPVPLILLVRIPRPTRWMYGSVYLCALVNSLATLQWMRLGDASMYPAWIALSIYVALYWPVFVGLSRTAVHRLRLPSLLAIPVVWTGLEFARAHVMTGFAWYYLGHTQYRWIELIQISDLVGAYGVSFVVALAAAATAGLVPPSWLARLQLLSGNAPAASSRLCPPARALVGSVAVASAVLAAVLAYGFVRRDEARFRAGPRVALIQGNFTSSLKRDPDEWGEIYRWHDHLTGLAVQHQPDLVVWPETMFRWPLMEVPPGITPEQLGRSAPGSRPEHWNDATVRRTLAEMSGKSGAAMIIGLDALLARPDRIDHYNSAAFVVPESGLRGRYDKMHRVPFGEYIPLQDLLPGLHKLTPFSAGFGISAGTAPAVFEFRGWSFSPIICFEDTVPHLVRRVAATTSSNGRAVDCLVNLTNDGWFHGSSELDQHLITAAFRAVECRTPLVRAVNTGISAVIDGDGVIREPDVFIDGDRPAGDPARRTSLRDPRTGRWHKQLNAALVADVPLDDRRSFYLEYGDWFAGGCAGFCVFVCLAACLPGLGSNRRAVDQPPEER